MYKEDMWKQVCEVWYCVAPKSQEELLQSKAKENRRSNYSQGRCN